MSAASQSRPGGRSVILPVVSLPRVAALIGAGIGVLVLGGWGFHIERLKRISPAFVAMNPVTAVSLILGGIGLVALAGGKRPRDPGPGAILVGRVVGGVLAALALIRVISYAAHLPFDIDQLLFHRQLYDPRLIGANRIAPTTAWGLMFIGLSLILASGKSGGLRVLAQFAATVTGFISLLGLVGYLYDADEFYGMGAAIPMALHAALGLMVLSLGLLFLDPERGCMRVFTSDGAGGMLARRLLPAVIMIPILVGWGGLTIEHMQWADPELSAGLRSIANVMVLLGLTWWTADRLYRMDLLRRAAEAELAAATAAAQAANRAKSAFLANMSHEIRTPMSAIIGYADLMLDPEVDASERLNNVNIIRRNGEFLLTLINDILDLSKIEAGQLAVESIECAPCQIVGEVASVMRVRAAERRIELQVKVNGPVPNTIRSDPTRLRQILINLVGNAIKFTESGWVRLELRLEKSKIDGQPLLRFDVIDTGVGIDREAVGNLFQPFTQAEMSTARQFGGTGLGLSISRRLARSLGGEVTVDSAPGRGSRFTVTVATGPLDDVTMVSECDEAVSGRQDAHPGDIRLKGRILLAEDGVDNRRLLTRYLSRAGADVTVAENGLIALEMIGAAAERGEPFDLIFMDMRMPELDGYGATAKLRSRGITTPIVALTAHAMAEDRDNCLRCGCTDYLSKPVHRTELLEMARGYLSQSPEKAAAISREQMIRAKVEPLDPEVQEFLPAFLEGLPAQVSELLRTLDQQNIDALADVVHQLKGSGGMYGFDPISAQAAAAERAIREKPIESIAGEIRSLVDLVRRVEGYDRTKERERSRG